MSKTELAIRSFQGQILYFNGMYKLPVAPYPSLRSTPEPTHIRLDRFRNTLSEELGEVDDIILSWQSGIRMKDGVAVQGDDGKAIPYNDEIDLLTDIADWLGDITVYCASEAAKFGIPMNEVLRVIMQSNFSKLQADGTVKYDANGKVEKGPGYWKPEPLIRDILLEARAEAERKGAGNESA